MTTTSPSFLITIDTEGDNAWARAGEPTTENAKFLGRFQALCERYQLKPTYLTNYEMAKDSCFIEMASDAIARGTAEVGMHLHAWHSPPLEPPRTPDDNRYHPFLIEYPVSEQRAKITFMTRLLEDTFERKMTSHRAGRWAMGPSYARILSELGYVVDCSATPHVSWRSMRGDPTKSGGTDYRFAPCEPYFMSSTDVARRGDGPLLEVPMTILPRRSKISQKLLPSMALRSRIGNYAAKRLMPNDWLRPTPGQLSDLLNVVDRCRAKKRDYAMFMIHSSELMPNGSQYFPEPDDIERLYDAMEALFAHIQGTYHGETVSEYAVNWIAKHTPAHSASAHLSANQHPLH